VLRNHPLAARLLPKLLYQLVPAALVTTVGVLLLSNLAKTPDTVPAAAPIATAINAEAIFKIVPREMSADAEQDSRRAKGVQSRPAATPKPPAPTPPSRNVASLPAPLPIVTIAEPPQPVAAAPDGGVMSKLRSATTAVQQIPQWAGRSVAGWFAADTHPPRPPALVPAQNFQAAM
jgi:hypothetical protein